MKLSDSSTKCITFNGLTKRQPRSTSRTQLVTENQNVGPEAASPVHSYPTLVVCEQVNSPSNVEELRGLMTKFQDFGQRQARLLKGMSSALTWSRKRPHDVKG